MNNLKKTLIYTGPSASAQTVQRFLPDGHIKPPIQRGDLYRDREQGGSLFLILDGVLIQQASVPPREIIDVLEDGGVVIGACSMGALRAAECWPAGMLGTGSIYRLFRRGCLHSEDEVLLTFAVEDDYRPLSEALINIRYALRQAVRTQRLTVPLAKRIIQNAEALQFQQRHWPILLAQVDVYDQDLLAFLAAQDLKQQDAVHVLRQVARGLARSTYKLQSNRTRFTSSKAQREQAYAELAGYSNTDKIPFARWQLISGRYRRHALAIAAIDANHFAQAMNRKQALNQALTGGNSSPHQSLDWVLIELWQQAGKNEQHFAEKLWEELSQQHELSAELMRWRAILQGAQTAQQRGLATRPQDIYLAGTEIAHSHGFHGWRQLRQNQATAPYPWSEFEAYRSQLALAKRWRAVLFNVAT